MLLGMYIMPPEAISMAYFINHSNSNTNIAASQILFYWPLRVQTEVFFLLAVSDTQITVKGKSAISSSQNFLFRLVFYPIKFKT
jgi:hypothetical protein